MAEKLTVYGSKRLAYQGIKMSLYREEIFMAEASERDIYSYQAMKTFRAKL
jgi:hypothetical protein